MAGTTPSRSRRIWQQIKIECLYVSGHIPMLKRRKITEDVTCSPPLAAAAADKGFAHYRISCDNEGLCTRSNVKVPQKYIYYTRVIRPKEGSSRVAAARRTGTHFISFFIVFAFRRRDPETRFTNRFSRCKQQQKVLWTLSVRNSLLFIHLAE